MSLYTVYMYMQCSMYPEFPVVGAPHFYVGLGTEEWNLSGDQDICLLEGVRF